MNWASNLYYSVKGHLSPYHINEWGQLRRLAPKYISRVDQGGPAYHTPRQWAKDVDYLEERRKDLERKLNLRPDISQLYRVYLIPHRFNPGGVIGEAKGYSEDTSLGGFMVPHYPLKIIIVAKYHYLKKVIYPYWEHELLHAYNLLSLDHSNWDQYKPLAIYK